MFQAVELPQLGSLIIRLIDDDVQCVVDEASPLLSPWCQGLGPGNQPLSNGRRLLSASLSLLPRLTLMRPDSYGAAATTAASRARQAVAVARQAFRSFAGHDIQRRKVLQTSTVESDSSVRTLTCGEEHQRLFGFTGYERPGYWCYIAKEVLVLALGERAGG